MLNDNEEQNTLQEWSGRSPRKEYESGENVLRYDKM